MNSGPDSTETADRLLAGEQSPVFLERKNEMNDERAMLEGYTYADANSKNLAVAEIQPEFAKICQRVACSADRIQGASDKLAALADRLFGERPEVASNAVINPSRPGALGSVDDMLDVAERAITLLHDQLNRFDNLV